MSILLSRGRNVLCAFSVVLICLGSSASAGVIDDIVADVDQDIYTYYHQDLLYTSPGDDRGLSGTEHTLARDNIFDTWTDLGLNTALDSFLYGGNTHNNVVAIQPGVVTPDTYYVVGGHYDSVSNPGADDNASGVAGVMEAARVLSQYEFESSLVYIAFDCEEQGLFGSTHYANAHGTDDIQSMISMDMIGYSGLGGVTADQADIHYDTHNDPLLTQGLANSLFTHGGITASITRMDPGRSDHVPFDDEGFSAAILIESTFSTVYHTADDNVEFGLIDYAYATNMTRGVVGYLADAAVYYEAALVVPEPSSLVLAVLALVSLVGWSAARRRRRSLNTS